MPPPPAQVVCACASMAHLLLEMVNSDLPLHSAPQRPDFPCVGHSRTICNEKGLVDIHLPAVSIFFSQSVTPCLN